LLVEYEVQYSFGIMHTALGSGYKRKVIPVLNYIIKHYAIKAWGSGSIAPPFLTLALDGGSGADRPQKCITDD
jgi:hypothetical protein